MTASGLELFVEPASVTPGQAVRVPLRVRNDGPTAVSALVRAIGIPESSMLASQLVGPIEPGTELLTDVIVALPTGFPACQHLAGVEAQPADPATGNPVGDPAVVEMPLTVGEGAQIDVHLIPPDVEGGRGGKFKVRMRNRSREAMALRLSAEVPGDEVQVRFASDQLVLAPGNEVEVKAKAWGRRPMTGSPRRLPYVVRVQGKTTPVQVNGSISQRAILTTNLISIVVLLTVIAVWASLLVVGVNKITAKPSQADQAAQAAAEASSSSASEASAASSAGGGSGGGSTSSSSGGGTAAATSGSSTAVRVGGTVTAPDRSGFTVTLKQTSLVDEEAQGATLTDGAANASSNAKAFGRGVAAASAVAAVQPELTTVTDADGAWAFAGIKAPAFYLVTIAKPGYGTRKYVIATTDDGKPVKLDAPMVAGDGSLAGMVTGPDGQPLGGVDLTITDGTVTATASTPTTGAIGSWSVSGLTTPSSYLITAKRAGYSTETQLVDLGAGGSNGSVLLSLRQGLASIAGKVSQSDPVKGTVGLGGITVTATDGTITRSVTSLTRGDATGGTDPNALVGSYTLPDLPIPGTYTLSFSGQGFSTSTQNVTLTDNTTVNALLVASTGELKGTVSFPDADPHIVGITISNETTTLKTTSGTDPTKPGQFDQEGIPPGTYVVTFESFGLNTTSQSNVVIDPGAVVQLDVTMTQTPQDQQTFQGSVLGTVSDAQAGGVPLPVSSETAPGTIDDAACLRLANHVELKEAASTSDPNDPANGAKTLCAAIQPDGTFRIGSTTTSGQPTGVDPGIHTIDVFVAGYEHGSGRVRVLPQQQATTSVALTKLAIVTGTVRNRVDNSAVVNDGTLVVTAIRCSTDTSQGQCAQADPNVPNVLGQLNQTNHQYDGTFTFDGTLVDGQYRLQAIDDTHNPSPAFTTLPLVTIAGGSSYTVDILVDQLGALRITARYFDRATGTTPGFSGVKIELSGGPTSKSPQTIGVDSASGTDPVVFANLLPGTYTLKAEPPTGSQFDQPQPGTATVSFNATQNYAFLFTKGIGPDQDLAGSVFWTRDDGSHSAIAKPPAADPATDGPARATLSQAITGFTFNVDTFPFVTATPNFAPIDPATCLTATPKTCAETDQSGAFTLDLSPFLSIGNVTVSAPNFVSRTLPPSAFIDPHSTPQIELQPVPGSLTGTVTLNQGTHTDPVSSVTATITPSGTGVTATVNSSGAIQVVDPRVQGGVRPGTYTITVSRAGYESASATATVYPGGSCPTGVVSCGSFGTLTLNRHVDVTVTVTCKVGFSDPDAPISTRVTSSRGGVAVAPGSTSQAGTSATYRYPDNVAGSDTLDLTMAGTGCDQQTVHVPLTAGDDVSSTYDLVAEGTIGGTVNRQINGATSALAGATVHAKRHNDPTSARFDTTTDANGHYVFIGTLDKIGLLATDTTSGDYDITIDVPTGYTVTTPVPAQSLSQGQDLTAPTALLVAQPATVTGTVKDGVVTSTNPHPIGLAGVLVTATSAFATAPDPIVTDANGSFAFSDSCTLDSASCGPSLQPVGWTFNFSLPDYSPFRIDQALSPAQAVTLNVPLAATVNTISGVTSGRATTSGTASPLSGVTVALYQSDGVTPVMRPDGTTPVSAVSGPTGAYTITGVRNNSYVIKASHDPEYASTSSTWMSIVDTPSVTYNTTLTALPRTVTFTVKSAVGPTALAGADVHLTPVTATTGCAGSSVTTDTNGLATFNSVDPGVTYGICIPSFGGHLSKTDGTVTVPIGDPAVAVSPATNPQVISEARISGTVKERTQAVGSGSPTDNPIAATVHIKDGSGADVVPAITTTGSGAYSAFVPPTTGTATYTVSVSVSGDTDFTASHAATSGSDVTINPLVVRLGSIVVTVTSGSPSAALAGAAVVLSPPPPHPPSTMTTDASGQATYTQLDAGTSFSAKAFTPNQTHPTASRCSASTTVVPGPSTTPIAIHLVDGNLDQDC